MKKFWGRLPEKNGMDNQKIFLIKCHDLVAAVSTTNKSRLAESEDNLRRHEEILSKYMGARPILPFRFSSVVGETVGRGILQKYYHQLMRNLEAVKDGVEYRVTIIRHNPASARKIVNLLDRRSYRNSLAAGEDDGPRTAKIVDVQTKVLASQIHQNFAGFASRFETDLLQSRDVLLKAEYLVEKKDAVKFEAEKERVRRLYPNVMVLTEGPFPPYNFNSINITDGNDLRFIGALPPEKN